MQRKIAILLDVALAAVAAELILSKIYGPILPPEVMTKIAAGVLVAIGISYLVWRK